METEKVRFDRYELLSTLGTGGMGAVYKARAVGPHGFEKVVALKRILSRETSDDSVTGRFISEAQIAARLQHPNIVQVFDFGQFKDELFIVMELVDGCSLEDIIELHPRLDPAIALQIIADIARALEYAHRLEDDEGMPVGVIHRDVNPANILISRDGGVKLADFGIAGWAQSPKTSLIAGKPLYMSPEQLLGESLDGRADLFAVGITLYEILTGAHPWEGIIDPDPDTTLESMEYVPASDRVGSIPAEFDELIESLIAPDRDDRYKSAGELLKRTLQVSYRSSMIMDQLELRPFVSEIAKTSNQGITPQANFRTETLVALGQTEEGGTLLSPKNPSKTPPKAQKKEKVISKSEMISAETLVSSEKDTRPAESDWDTIDSTQTPKPVEKRVRRNRALPLVVGVVISISIVFLTAFIVSSIFSGLSGVETNEPSEPEIASLKLLPPPEAGIAEEPPEPPSKQVKSAQIAGEKAPQIPQDTKSIVNETEHEETLQQKAQEAKVSRPIREKTKRNQPRKRTKTGSKTIPQSGAGTLDIFSQPWAEIYIDGVRHSRNAPARNISVSAGVHRVKLVNPVLGLTAHRSVKVAPGKNARIRVFLKKNQ